MLELSKHPFQPIQHASADPVDESDLTPLRASLGVSTSHRSAHILNALQHGRDHSLDLRVPNLCVPALLLRALSGRHGVLIERHSFITFLREFLHRFPHLQQFIQFPIHGRRARRMAALITLMVHCPVQGNFRRRPHRAGI